MKENNIFTLTPGSYFKEAFDDYESMISATKVWSQVCTYQMKKGGFSGEHEFLHLENILLSYGIRDGSLYYDVISPKDCISVVIIEKCEGKACFGSFKLQTNDIIVFDSIENFMMNTSINFTILSIPKLYLRKLNILSKLTSCINKKLYNTDELISKQIHSVFDKFKNKKYLQDKNFYPQSEKKIIENLLFLIDKQKPMPQKLTKGESTVLIIKENLYKHIDKTINITLLTNKYPISERTLQKSFQSLFGFSPNDFLRILKLNHVHKELQESSVKDITVSSVASKWGFAHMSRFAAYYKELFEVNPSVTLYKSKQTNKNIDHFCTV